MPPALTLTRALTSWTADWPSLAVGVPALVGYLLVARGRAWPRARTVSFVAGVLVVLVCTCSFLGVYDRVLFWPRAVQNVALAMATPMLAAMGAPLTLALAVAPPAVLAAIRRAGRGRGARLLGSPFTATAALLVPLPVLYLSGLYRLTLAHGWLDALVRAGLVGCGFVYYWTRLRVDPVPGAPAHVVSFAITFAETLVDGLLGVIVWLGPLIAPGHYLALHRGWGPTARQDQTTGAVVLWFGGDLIGIPYLVALLVAWTRSDQRAARRVDAELDAQARRAVEDGEPAVDAALQPGLWWQTDPRFADRFGAPPPDER